MNKKTSGTPTNPQPGRGGLDRRDFLRLAGVASVAGAVGAGLGVRPVGAAESETFDHEVDVAVVGSGAAGAVSAIFAHKEGAKTLLVEKSLIFGGTTAKSGGVYWVPNATFLRKRGTEEPREATIAKMAQHSYPHLFDAESPTLGLPQNEYELIAAFYDNASPAVDKLAEWGALFSMPAEEPFGAMPDYFEEATDDKTPRDRRMWPRKPDGSFGLGDEMVRQLKAALVRYEVPLLMGHRVTSLLRNGAGAVVGLEATKMDGTVVRIRARKGVVFGSGGFTHNDELMLHYQAGPHFGGCAVPTNEGDFVYMATAAGAKLGHMSSAWRAQIVLEQALQFSSTPDDVFMPPGDATVLVNKYGRRVVNETANYNERTRAHHEWDAVAHEWPNLLMFMVYDQRVAELFGGRFPIPAAGTQAPYAIKAETLEELATAIDARLESFAKKTGGVRLDEGFSAELAKTVERFNGFAESGDDEDFHRGRMLYDRMWHSRIWSFANPDTGHDYATKPNITMYPLADKGPYYAIVLAPGTLDTNGGPITDASARILAADGEPIAGLYGVGNCVSSPTGAYYYGGGGTLGPCMAFGLLAGKNAAAEPDKPLT